MGVKPGKRYSPDEIEQAFNLFCEGKSYRKIRRILKIGSEETLVRWHRKYNWDKRRTEIIAKAERKTDEKKSRDIADIRSAATEKHARAADSLIGIIVFEINRLIEPMKQYVQAVNTAKASGGDVSKIEPPKAVDVGRVRKLISSLKDAVFVERQALGMSTSSAEIEARVKRDLFDFDKSGLDAKERKKLTDLESEYAAILEGKMTAGDDIEDYAN